VRKVTLELMELEVLMVLRDLLVLTLQFQGQWELQGHRENKDYKEYRA
jgi:hypothetical protein